MKSIAPKRYELSSKEFFTIDFLNKVRKIDAIPFYMISIYMDHFV